MWIVKALEYAAAEWTEEHYPTRGQAEKSAEELLDDGWYQVLMFPKVETR